MQFGMGLGPKLVLRAFLILEPYGLVWQMRERVLEHIQVDRHPAEIVGGKYVAFFCLVKHFDEIQRNMQFRWSRTGLVEASRLKIEVKDYPIRHEFDCISLTAIRNPDTKVFQRKQPE